MSAPWRPLHLMLSNPKSGNSVVNARPQDSGLFAWAVWLAVVVAVPTVSVRLWLVVLLLKLTVLTDRAQEPGDDLKVVG